MKGVTKKRGSNAKHGDYTITLNSIYESFSESISYMFSSQEKKMYQCIVVDVNKTYCADHFTIYINTKSPHCALETNIMLYINYT